MFDSYRDLILKNTFGAIIMITRAVTKITRLIITTIIITKTITFPNVIGYHKPQFGLYGGNVRVMLINEHKVIG